MEDGVDVGHGLHGRDNRIIFYPLQPKTDTTLCAQSFMHGSSMRDMVDDNERARRAFAKFLQAHKKDGVSGRAISEAAGLSPSAASQFLAGRSRSPKVETLKKLAKGAGEILGRPVPVSEIIGGADLAPARAAEAAPGSIPTRGEVAAGQWLDLDVQIDPSDFEQFPITADPRYPTEAQYGLIVKGTSINRVADAGDVLHCLDLGVSAVEPDENDVVIVERRRAQYGQKEVTAKRIRRRGRVIVLAPDSTDDKWKPIELDPKKAQEEEEVGVVAVVLAVYKPLRGRKL